MPAEAIAPVLFLFALVAACTALAQKTVVPAPVLLAGIGVALGFVPWTAAIQLQPRTVLLGVLPPLVYAAAVELPWADFRDNLADIGTLAAGLVIATTAFVAWLAHALIPGLGWGPAFALGTILSPTDPVASTAVANRLGVPRRLVAIIEGEGMVNDAVALTLYGLAVAAIAGGSFSIRAGVLRFVLIVVGETAFGAGLGWCVARLRERIFDARVEITISLLTPFAAYLPAEALGGSGVLATLAAGIYIGTQTAEMMPSGTRLHLAGVWDIITYLLNGWLFLLTGIQFHRLLTGATGFPAWSLCLFASAVSLAVVAVRFAWIWPAALRFRARHRAFLAWCGMRGGISLAAALALPVVVPERPLILFLTTSVIAATLLVQGSTLPALIRALGMQAEVREERARARRKEVEAALEAAGAALDSLGPHDEAYAEPLRAYYKRRIKALRRMLESDKSARADFAGAIRLQRDVIAAERKRIIGLHREGRIPDEVLRRLERDLDLQETRLQGSLLGAG